MADPNDPTTAGTWTNNPLSILAQQLSTALSGRANASLPGGADGSYSGAPTNSDPAVHTLPTPAQRANYRNNLRGVGEPSTQEYDDHLRQQELAANAPLPPSKPFEIALAQQGIGPTPTGTQSPADANAQARASLAAALASAQNRQSYPRAPGIADAVGTSPSTSGGDRAAAAAVAASLPVVNGTQSPAAVNAQAGAKLQAALQSAQASPQVPPPNALQAPVAAPASVSGAPSSVSSYDPLGSIQAEAMRLHNAPLPPSPSYDPLSSISAAQTARPITPTPSAIALGGGTDNARLAAAAMIPTSGTLNVPAPVRAAPPSVARGSWGNDPVVEGWQGDAVHGGYGRDQEVQGNASNWGPTTEILNGAMLGQLPAFEGWIGNHLPPGWMPSGEQIKADRDAYAAQHPTISAVANMTGGSLPYVAAGEVAAPLDAVGRIGTMMATGGGTGFLQGVASGQDPLTAGEAGLVGAAGGGLGELGGAALGKVIGGGVDKVAGWFNPRSAIPALDQINAAKNAAYKASEAAGDIASPQGLQRLKGNIQNEMAQFGYDPAQQPGGQAVINKMNSWPTAPGQATAGATLKDIDTFRQIINRMRESGASGAQLASNLTKHVDDFVANPQPGDWLTGAGPQGAAALNEGRRLAQIAFKADDLQAFQKAEDQAAASGSGGNARNKLARAMVKLKYSGQNWTPDELSALNAGIKPGRGEQLMRVWGKGDPTAHGILPMLGEGALAFAGGEHVSPQLMVAAAPVVGGAMVARRLSDAMMRKAAGRVSDTILNGGVDPNAPNVVQQFARTWTPPLARRLGTAAAAASPSLLQRMGAAVQYPAIPF